MLTVERRRVVAMARRMQGTKPRHAAPGIQDSFGGGRPNRYLGLLCQCAFGVLLPDGAQLGNDEGNSEGGNGGQEQGAWECAEVGNPEGT